MPKPRICHRCGKPITGHFCPCRRRKGGKSTSSGSSGSPAPMRSRAVFIPPFMTSFVQAVPMWESNHDKFWRDVVESVRTSHAADGTRYVTARWAGNEHTFTMDDAAPFLARYFEPTGATA